MGGTSLAAAERSVIEIELRRADASCPPFVVPALPAPVIVVPTTTCCDDHLDLVADPAGRSARTVLPSPDTLVKLALVIDGENAKIGETTVAAQWAFICQRYVAGEDFRTWS